jgi:hypothetical protein
MNKKRLLTRWGGGLLVLVAMQLGVMLLGTPSAEAFTCPQPAATPFNTTRWCGYFYRGPQSTGNNVVNGGVPASVNSTATFINFVNGMRTGGNTQQRVAAAFIILTMLRVNSAPGAVTLATANARYTEWVNLVNAYGAAGKITFFYAYPFPCGIVNSFYQPAFQDDAYYFEPASQGVCGPGVTQSSIIFRDLSSSTIVYAIRRACANPIGNLPGLSPANFNLTGALSPGTGTPSFSGIVQPGATYNLTPSVSNPSTGSSVVFTMEVSNLSPAYIQNAGVSTPGPYDTDSAIIYAAVGCNGTSPCWQWSYATLPPGATSSQSNGARFTIAPATPEGTSVCFGLRIAPSNTAGAVLTQGPYCFVVYRPHYPGIIGEDGDVHAGGGICGQAQNPTGAITGNSGAASLGAYVVSASGTVSAFGSNNAAAGNGATLGRTGDYYAICRPDLVEVGRSYFLSGQPYLPLLGNNIDVGTLAAGVYVHNGGGNVRLHGTVTQKVTILSLTDSLIIDAPIILNSPTTTGNNVPSLGIISAGNIIINGAANRVDAYLFSNGTIDTCAEGNAAACRNTLTVNGFLMANTLSFRRLGPVTGGGATVGERVNMAGQIYLNPPKLFDSAADVNLVQNQGEKPPLN